MHRDKIRNNADNSPPRLGDDLLRGASEIAHELGENERRIHHLIRTRRIPFFKLGGKLYSRRSVLRKFIKQLEKEARHGR